TPEGTSAATSARRAEGRASAATPCAAQGATPAAACAAEGTSASAAAAAAEGTATASAGSTPAGAKGAAAREGPSRVAEMCGEGRAFSAGQDLTEDRLPGPDGKADFGARLERDYNPLVERIYGFPKVTIAALNGAAVGASANIALACDILVAARSAYLQEAFA